MPSKAPYSLSTADAAHLLGCDRTHVVHLIRAGTLRALNIGTEGGPPTFRISPADLHAFIARRVSP